MPMYIYIYIYNVGRRLHTRRAARADGRGLPGEEKAVLILTNSNVVYNDCLQERSIYNNSYLQERERERGYFTKG